MAMVFFTEETTMTKLEAYNAKIDARNKAFKSLSKAEKRVAIAKDCIQQLELKKIRATQGTYFQAKVKLDSKEHTSLPYYSSTPVTETVVDTDMQVQKVVQSMKSCNACALGTVFACTVGIANKLKINDLNKDYESTQLDGIAFDGSTMYDYLRGFFTTKQLTMIECAFEKYDTMGERSEAGHANQLASALFGRKYPSAKARMIAIMKNVIKNGGEFVVPAEAVVHAKKLLRDVSIDYGGDSIIEQLRKSRH